MSEHQKKIKLWQGEVPQATDALIEQINSSISVDKRMWKDDIEGSKAYAKALLKAELITSAELEAMLTGLNSIAVEWENGSFEITSTDDDVHTANERRLASIIGRGIAGKLHTGRSRNDQVVADIRLWLRSQIDLLKEMLCSLIHTAVDRAEVEIDVLMPGYTHMQRAQPIRWSHWLMSYAVCFLRDLDILKEIRNRVNVLPLGSGNLGGNPFPIDQKFLAEELGFQSLSLNSMDATGSRDFIGEMLFWASQVCSHLSRLATDLMLYTSAEFSFVYLSGTSSIESRVSPQKKSLEAMRGKSGTVIGRCTGFMTTMKGLPSTYNKDLQEDKAALFEVCDTTSALIQIATGVITSLSINPTKMKAALSLDVFAIDIAHYLVRKGVPFREAHSISGTVVKKSEDLKCSLDEIPFNELTAISGYFEKDIGEIWDFERSVEQYQSLGGTSKSSVLAQICSVRKSLKCI